MPTKTPAIGLSPTSLRFDATQGGSNPASQTVAVSNTGQGGSTLNWTQTDNAAWLTVTPASGTNSGTLTCSVATGSLVAGTYNATITVSASGASNTPQTVAVTFVVAAQTFIFHGSSTVSGGGTLVSAGVASRSGTSALSGGGSGTLAVVKNAVGISSLFGGGTLVSTGSVPVAGVHGSSATIGGGSFTSHGRSARFEVTAISGGGTLSSSGSKPNDGQGKRVHTDMSAQLLNLY